MTKFSEIELPRKIKDELALLPPYLELEHYEFLLLEKEGLVEKPFYYDDWVKKHFRGTIICYLTVRGTTYAEYLQELYRMRQVTDKRAKWSFVISVISLFISAFVAITNFFY